MSSSTDPAPAAPERERLVDQAYRQIRDDIVALRLQPGTPLAETALDSLEYERGLGLDRPRKAGLTPDEEQEILTAVG